MAHFRTEIFIEASPAKVWDAVRDVGAVHRRLVPGLLTDTVMDGDEARIVTFATGMVLRELIVDIDDSARRLVWAVVGKPVVHHQGVMQVRAEGGGSRVSWDADILPAGLIDTARPHMERGMAVMKATLEQNADDRL
jgi:carbon monoxide dehydrogenase subunit G